jgi:predicted kinase
VTTATPPVRLALPGRTLLLVAGMPGAGKSTLLSTLPAADGLAVLDSESQRAALRPLARGVPYAWQRPVVHLLHRSAVVAARRGQYERGRLVPEASFQGHARRAAVTAAELLADPPPEWRSVTVLDRAAARGGLRLDTAPADAAPVPVTPAGRPGAPTGVR